MEGSPGQGKSGFLDQANQLPSTRNNLLSTKQLIDIYEKNMESKFEQNVRKSSLTLKTNFV